MTRGIGECDARKKMRSRKPIRTIILSDFLKKQQNGQKLDEKEDERKGRYCWKHFKPFNVEFEISVPFFEREQYPDALSIIRFR